MEETAGLLGAGRKKAAGAPQGAAAGRTPGPRFEPGEEEPIMESLGIEDAPRQREAPQREPPPLERARARRLARARADHGNGARTGDCSAGRGDARGRAGAGGASGACACRADGRGPGAPTAEPFSELEPVSEAEAVSEPRGGAGSHARSARAFSGRRARLRA